MMPFDSTVSTASAATVSQKVVAYTQESEKRQLKCIRPKPKTERTGKQVLWVPSTIITHCSTSAQEKT